MTTASVHTIFEFICVFLTSVYVHLLNHLHSSPLRLRYGFLFLPLRGITNLSLSKVTLAALAYCDGHYLLNRNRKLVLDPQSGTSLCLPTDPQFGVGSYLEAKSALLSAISGVIADFRIPLTYSPRPEGLFPQIVHYTNDGMCILVADSRSSQCYDGFDAEGITVFNPSGICRAVESKMRLTQKQLLTFNAFMDSISHPDSDDEDDGTGGAPPGFTWDNNCGSPQLVPVEGDSLDGY